MRYDLCFPSFRAVWLIYAFDQHIYAKTFVSRMTESKCVFSDQNKNRSFRSLPSITLSVNCSNSTMN